ncbi:NADP-dependent malic enzyme, partial [Patescibacteria group bacterium]|nr:NADP-dependent malic enzyme [Patescibacteria group bacterium]
LTSRRNWVAVVSDGSAVLGLGNIGPEAAMPVMEGKAILFKEFANVDAFPICLNTQDTEEIIETVKRLEPTFGGINLEDISAPRCFEIEERLKKEMNIPVFHDDQHGTAVVVLAGLINAAKVVKKDIKQMRAVITGAGAAGTAITKLLISQGIGDIVLVDSQGIIGPNRNDLNESKIEMLKVTNKQKISGLLKDALFGSDIFIGVSKAGILSEEMIKTMARSPIVFAMANPDPEIMPDIAKSAGAAVVATGRSDFPNQLNNVLAFPGIFRGTLDAKVSEITEAMKLAAAKALADSVEDPSPEKIIPSPFQAGIAKSVALAVSMAAKLN